MLNAFRETLSALKSGEMDFEGQDLAANIMWNGMAIAVVAAIILGSVTRRFEIMVHVVTVAAIVVGVLIIPSWPMYRKNLLRWQPAVEEPNSDTEDAEDDDEDDDSAHN
eukprot:Gregarina_sp_Poly_1__8015@NODE_45_length_17866_cov_75_803753_g39_i0_p13_GENE_NODE_45_length_17866_cov_75_803753_g39_i0NODE_45_length_17866_cov_75_803753_g39_i0_p13_ORF_typecomplete_len109_score17_82SPC12/PF06645_13/3_2e18DUF973/PF06157_11/0_03TraG_N/PF07916_11/0_047DUF4335/PF14233_6/0_11DUF2207/PF09972_9/0_057PTPS_related/PF10131_9/0_13Wzy_C/PF04932_15/0_18DUF983/PF06170_12/0_19SLATT_3/PF18184_1/0_27Trp_oprn_chp/PF09534_10/0_46_NODE_45_length_17866_cov_75_803753_g39_i01626316589